MGKTVIRNAELINEGRSFNADVVIDGPFIERVEERGVGAVKDSQEIVADGCYMIPGAIDDQVHFREPGLTHKEDIAGGSRAAAAGGITGFMEMPNTVPNTLTQELLQDKYDIAERTSYVNYSFYMGASNDNIDEVLKTDPATVCGIKAFLGSSTGNMLVDDEDVLYELFSRCHMLLATHCEDEPRVRQRTKEAIEKWGDEIPVDQHPIIRDHEACYLSSSRAVKMARELGTRLHVLHISTADELQLFEAGPLEDKQITAEACIHHMWFNDKAYVDKRAFVKWNPAVKTEKDRAAILQAVVDDRIDIIATDHAPHTLEEKARPYTSCPSGGPLVQHAVPAMFELVARGQITKEQVVEKMCHAPAKMFHISKRGYLREGYYADLAVLKPNAPWVVDKESLLYRCGWSPMEGTTFSTKVDRTFVNGELVYENGLVYDKRVGSRMQFER